MNRTLPKYPIYVPSRGRSDKPLTARFLQKDAVPFRMVVEPREEQAYRAVADDILVLPWDGDDAKRRKFCRDRSIDNGGLCAVRNWIKEHAIAAGAERHWQIDDNIRGVKRWWRDRRRWCASGAALRATEDFVDRYENVALAGLNYSFFSRSGHLPPKDPFWLNVHVYSCTLVLNRVPIRWRLAVNDDVDISLQVLSAGWCTVLMNAFMVDKVATMTMRGGMTDEHYGGDGRCVGTRALERMWPGVVRLGRRWQRPHHVVAGQWRKFNNRLLKKPEFANMAAAPNEYGMKLVKR